MQNIDKENENNNKAKENKQKKKGLLRKLNVSTVLLVLGVLIMLYPFASGFVKNILDNKMVSEFRINKMMDESWEDFKSSMKEYNEDIKEGAFNSNAGNLSFDLEDDSERDENENKSVIDQSSVLDASGESKIIGTLIIPKIDEEIPMYYGSNSRVLQKGVGILENTSYPGDETGHSIITGHRGTHNAKIFRHLDEVEKGDHFYVETPDDFLKYLIYEYEIVEPDMVQLLGIEEGRDLVTLVTCHPFLINTERILVKAERTAMTDADYEYLGITEENKVINPAKTALMEILDDELLIGLLLLNLVILIIAIVLIIIIRKRDKNNNDEVDSKNKEETFLKRDYEEDLEKSIKEYKREEGDLK